MDLEFKGNEIFFNRELSVLDNNLLDFIEKLSNNNIKYTVTSGYIETFLGQNRTMGGIGILIRSITFERFLKLWLELEKTYECLNTDDPIDAYNGYLRNHHAIMIRKKNGTPPNLALRFVKNDLDRALYKNRKSVKIEERVLLISSLEIFIPYKLSLGSDKDIEDAKFLFRQFKDKLNIAMIEKFSEELEIPHESVNKHIGKFQ
jgi:hypothetical protein